MDAKEFLKAKGIHPTEPIYWDTTDKHGDRYIELHELMEEYASQTEMPSEEEIDKQSKGFYPDSYRSELTRIAESKRLAFKLGCMYIEQSLQQENQTED